MNLTKEELFRIMTNFRQSRKWIDCLETHKPSGKIMPPTYKEVEWPKTEPKTVHNSSDHIIRFNKEYSNDIAEIRAWYAEWDREVNRKLAEEEWPAIKEAQLREAHKRETYRFSKREAKQEKSNE